MAARYGDITYFKMGPQEVFLLNHPDFIKDVLITHHARFMKGRGLQWAKRFLGEGLLTSEGQFHRRQRRLSQPAFHRQRISTYGAVMADYGDRTAERWRDGQTVDMSEEMARLTLDVVAKTLFGADVDTEAAEIGWALTEVLGGFQGFMSPFASVKARLPLPSNRRFAEARRRLDGTIYRLIDERRASGQDRGDLLSMLLLAQDEEGDGQGMSDLQLRDEAMTIFLAGHETTANALTWTWYLLSQNPEVERRLHEEVDQVLGGRAPALEDIPQLRYVEMVLAESMRLYPPAWVLGRMALEPHEVAGYTVPVGAVVVMSQFVMHRDARFFPDPERMDPQRWTPEARYERPRHSYFPFGAGPRQCMGESFAWMEGILLLATLARKWRMKLVPGHPVVPQPLITLRPRHGMRMKLEKR